MLPLDKVIDKIVALGIPGLVLVIVVSTTGLVGAAAITTALALLGGPLGMLGGIATLGILLLISKAITVYGIEKIVYGVVNRFEKKGISKAEIIKKVESYLISKSLKEKIISQLNK